MKFTCRELFIFDSSTPNLGPLSRLFTSPRSIEPYDSSSYSYLSSRRICCLDVYGFSFCLRYSLACISLSILYLSSLFYCSNISLLSKASVNKFLVSPIFVLPISIYSSKCMDYRIL